jgi:hypothetical protein
MDALYQIRVHRAETDLAIDQLRETLVLLAAERVPGIGKLEKRLDEVGCRAAAAAAAAPLTGIVFAAAQGCVLATLPQRRLGAHPQGRPFTKRPPVPRPPGGIAVGWDQEGQAAGQEQPRAHPGAHWLE